MGGLRGMGGLSCACYDRHGVNHCLARGIHQEAVRGRQGGEVHPLLFWRAITPVGRVVSRQLCHQEATARVFAGCALPHHPRARVFSAGAPHRCQYDLCVWPPVIDRSSIICRVLALAKRGSQRSDFL